jgi:hypothetical protein
MAPSLACARPERQGAGAQIRGADAAGARIAILLRFDPSAPRLVCIRG